MKKSTMSQLLLQLNLAVILLADARYTVCPLRSSAPL